MTTKTMTPRSIITSAIVIALAYSANAFAEAGRVLFVLGQAQVVRADGIALSAVKGLDVENGDTIKTENNGQVQLKMTDGGMIAVRPNSLFKIDDYEYNGDVKKDKTVYRLLKGGFRSVTGKVGEKNKAAYAVKTPIATIGIRGTDYNARLCEFDCADAGVDNGLYVNVLSGGVVLANDAGNVVIGPTENGFVSDSWTTPTYIDQVPTELFFAQKATTTTVAANSTSNTTTPELANSQTLTTANGDQTDTTSFTLATTPSASTSDTTTSNGTSTAVIVADSSSTTTVDNSSTTAVSSSDTATTEPVATPPNKAYVGMSMNTAATNVDAVSSLVDTELTLDATTHELSKFAVKQTDVNGIVTTTTYDKNTAVNTSVGYDATTGVSWGVWTNGIVNVTHADGSVSTNTLGANDNLHWISTSPSNIAMALPSSGTATYKAVGFTPTTDNFGNTGSLNTASTTLTANFGTQTVDADISTTLNTAYGDVTWQISKSGMPITNGQFEGSTNIVVNNHPVYNDMASNTGHIAGAFTQPIAVDGVPQGAIVTYSASGDNAEATYTTIQGVALLQRQ